MKRPRCRRGAPLLLSVIALYGLLEIVSALAATGSVTYGYDALGRVGALLYDTGVCIAYTYDPNGNRTAQNVYAGGSGALSATWDTGVWGCFAWQ